MRFRLIKREVGAPPPPAPPAPPPGQPPPPPPPPEPKHAPPRAADLDNPYGRYYGKARSREDLRK